MDNLSEEFFDFIKKNLNKDPLALRLKNSPDKFDFDLDLAILQIESRRKYAVKLKKFLDNPQFLFPDSISGEQSSHQAIANYHSSLVGTKQKILDISAGLGIDSLSIAKNGNEVTAIEINSDKANTLELNAFSLGLDNFKAVNIDSIEYLKTSPETFDIIFADPARRDTSNKKVYNLHDCAPDVLKYQDLLLEQAPRILIKASPLLDISQTIKDFPNIKSIKAVGVKGECKEMLIELERGYSGETQTEAVNLDNSGDVVSRFIHTFGHSGSPLTYISEEDLKEGSYILEPSAMIMKLAPWESIASSFNVRKFGKSTHLFLSEEKPADFPGRVSRFEKIIKKSDRKSLSGLPASVVSKNHPLSSEEIRKSLRLKEGNQNFIYAVRIGEKPLMFISRIL